MSMCRELQTPISVSEANHGKLKRGDWIVEVEPGLFRRTNDQSNETFTLPQAVIEILIDTGETTFPTFEDTSR